MSSVEPHLSDNNVDDRPVNMCSTLSPTSHSKNGISVNTELIPLLQHPNSVPILLCQEPTISPPRPSPVIHAYALMFASTLAFSASSVLVHLAEVWLEFPTSLAILIRGIIQTTLSLFYFSLSPKFRSSLFNLTCSQLLYVLLRSVTGSLSIAALYAAVKLAPVGDVVAIYSINPAISVVFSTIFLRETIHGSYVLAAFAATFGAICVAGPHGLDSFHTVSGDWSRHAIGAGLAATAALLASISLMALRKLSIDAHFMIAVFSFGISAIIMGMPFLGDIINSKTNFFQRQYVFGGLAVATAAIGGFFGQCCSSRALRDCPVAPAAILLNLEVPMSYILGLMFLGEQPESIQTIGSMIIALSAVFIRLITSTSSLVPTTSKRGTTC